LAQAILQGILLGGVFALAGIGMTMIFGIVKLTNLAHGEFIILGAYLSALFTGIFGLHPLITIIIVAPVMFLFGYVFQRGLINRVMGRGDEPPLLVTFGISIIIQNLMLLLFSANPQFLRTSYQTLSIKVSEGFSIPILYLINFIISIIVILALQFFLKNTYIGKSIRAVSDDNAAASLMGVNVRQTYGIAMGIATATAAISGIIVGTTFNFYPHTGGEIPADIIRSGRHRRNGQHKGYPRGRPDIWACQDYGKQYFWHELPDDGRIYRIAAYAYDSSSGFILEIDKYWGKGEN